jgi:phosphomevalonate kinase
MQVLTTSIHNLAQICHCHAQGKVGSGFDVFSAMFGTLVYRRYPKCLLPHLLHQLEHNHDQHGSSGATLLTKLVELEGWNNDMVTLLPLLCLGDIQLVVADVRGGSESPRMATSVLKWK